MAGYHRFISYIYLYEQGNKTMNTGFAKVESRNGQCRITISMKNMYHESDVRFLAYMFVRQEGRLKGIYLGDLVTQNNTGELDAVTDSENIEGSGYTLEDVKGMIIRGDNGKIYGTGWDDEALDVRAFIPLGSEGQMEISETNSRTDAVLEAEEPDGEPQPQTPQPQTPQPQALQPQTSQPQMAFTDVRHFGDPDLPEKLDSTVPIEVKELSEGEMPDSKETLETGRDLSPMEKIIEQGMRMFPFDDDQMTACVRMEPQDIGMLPMKYWRLAGNSFLLHGYYSYRHLIMARRNDGTFIFGIPGVDYERERFMARMFGFNQFKPVRASAIGPGQFGYWYMELA